MSHDVEGTGQQIAYVFLHLLLNFDATTSNFAGRRGNYKLQRCIGHMMWMVLCSILCDLDPKVNVI